jgi:hypothetical protein
MHLPEPDHLSGGSLSNKPVGIVSPPPAVPILSEHSKAEIQRSNGVLNSLRGNGSIKKGGKTTHTEENIRFVF